MEGSHIDNIHMKFELQIGQRVKEDLAFNFFSIFRSGGLLVYRIGLILGILVGSHLENIPVQFESHWPKGSVGS